MKQSVTRRLVQACDEAFLFDLYTSTRAQELEVLPWDEDQRRSFLKMQFFAQNQDYQRRFPEGVHELLICGRLPAGRLYVARSEEEIRILDISLMPEYRNHGIGGALIRELLNEASQTKLPLRIYLERDNSYRKVFDQFGFATVDDIGSHLLLEWQGR